MGSQSLDAITGPDLRHPEILSVVRGVSLCILLAALDQTIIVPALPRIGGDFGGRHQLAWLVSAYLLAGTAATPIFGKLSDLYGQRRLLPPALLVFVLASLGCALAQSFGQMVAGRALQGLGGAGLITLAHSAIAGVASPRERGRYQIYMSGMWGIASIAGPIVGGTLTDAVSWRAIFWINLPLGLLAYWASRRSLAVLPAHEHGQGGIDYLGAVLLPAGITAGLAWVSGVGRDFAPASAAALALLGAAAALAGLTVWQERRAATPILPLHLFGNATLRGGFALSATNSLCTFGASLLLPLYFQYERHGSAAASGLFATPFLLAFVLMSYFGGRMSRALGRTRATMLVALVACLLGLVLLAGMRLHTALPLCALSMMVLGGGIGLVQPNVTVAIQNVVARPDLGAASGCMLLFRAIGGACGATLAGLMLVAHGFPAAFGACAVVAALSIVIAARMPDSILRG